MVKKFNEELRKEEIYHRDKLLKKTEQLIKLRKRDFIRDNKKAALKMNIQFKKKSPNIYDHLTHTSTVTRPSTIPPQQKELQNQIYSYKIAKQNVQATLTLLSQLQIKNERPSNYLVEMYKSDKQMLKIRKYLTQKQNKIKQKMQGHDWMSKTKKKQRNKLKYQNKKNVKKNKISIKKNKWKKDKINGKNKIRK